GKEKVHFEAPEAERLEWEMNHFLTWLNATQEMDPVIKAAIAHVWFVTIHPFDDGNGRIARAIGDRQMAHADGCAQRFYSLSAQIRKERKSYYEILERTQKGSLDITQWLLWYLECMDQSLSSTNEILAVVLKKARFWETHSVKTFNERQLVMLNKLLDGIEGKLTSSKWAKMAKCSQDTASRDIQDLMAKGILVKEEAGGRSTSYELKADIG
ncbi:MAG TPA: Fic family protein, partial [Flavisolibacter sp.]|nr:Fic family protein [Flavisolibacter sp.]